MEPAAQLKNLTVAHALTLRFGSILNLNELLRELAAAACELSQCERAVVLLADSENATLSVRAAMGVPQPELTFSTYNPTDPAIVAWLDRQPFAAALADLAPDSAIASLIQMLRIDRFYSVPLHEGDLLSAVIIVEDSLSQAAAPIRRTRCWARFRRVLPSPLPTPGCTAKSSPSVMPRCTNSK